MGRPRIAEEVSATLVVNLPELGYDSHVKRLVTVLAQHGYRAQPMTGDHILEMAEQLKRELADQAATQRIVDEAARRG
jgi:hypothetical protein